MGAALGAERLPRAKPEPRLVPNDPGAGVPTAAGTRGLGGAAGGSAAAGAGAGKSAEAGEGAPDLSVSDMCGVCCDEGGPARKRAKAAMMVNADGAGERSTPAETRDHRAAVGGWQVAISGGFSGLHREDQALCWTAELHRILTTKTQGGAAATEEAGKGDSETSLSCLHTRSQGRSGSYSLLATNAAGSVSDRFSPSENLSARRRTRPSRRRQSGRSRRWRP